MRRKLSALFLAVLILVPFITTPVHADSIYIDDYKTPLNGLVDLTSGLTYKCDDDVYFVYGIYEFNGTYPSGWLDTVVWSFHSFTVNEYSSDGSLSDSFNFYSTESLGDGRTIYVSRSRVIPSVGWQHTAVPPSDLKAYNNVPSYYGSWNSQFFKYPSFLSSGFSYNYNAPLPAVNLGQLHDIKYSVTKNATLEESYDAVSWNRENDTNSNIFDSSYSVDISVIPSYCAAASEKEWYNKTLADWVLNDSTQMSVNVPATIGQYSFKWSDLVSHFAYDRDFYTDKQLSDGSYQSHAWVYRIRLKYGSQTSSWMTVYPFVAGDKASIGNAMQSNTYNSYTSNVLNSLAVTTVSNNTTTVSSVNYNYTYNIVNQYDNSTHISQSVPGVSHPDGENNTSNPVAAVTQSLWDRIIDLFNQMIGFVTGSLFAGVTGLASGFVAKTGFLGQCIALVPQCLGLLVSSLSTHSDAVLKWNNVMLMDNVLIPAGEMNLDSACSSYGLDLVHNLCKICMDASVLLYLSFKVYQKTLEILKRGSV